MGKERVMRLHCLVLLAALAMSLTAKARAGSSNSLLDVSPDGRLLLVANPDNGTVTVVDTLTRKSIHEIEVGEKPEGVTWIGSGPLAAVTVYREDKVVFLDARQGRVLKRLAVAEEPYGIVADRAGTTAWVTHEYPGLVSKIDLREMKLAGTTKAGSFVRGLALSPDERRLYVTEFLTGALHALDLVPGVQPDVSDTWKGHSTDNL